MKKMIFAFLLLVIIIGCNQTFTGNTSITIDENSLDVETTYTDMMDEEIKSLASEQIHVEETTFDDLLMANQHKEIKQGIYQTVTWDSDIISFYTFKKEQSKFLLIDNHSFSNVEDPFAYELGKFYYELWIEIEDFFFSYSDLVISNEFLDAAKLGHMYSSTISIGTTKDQLLEAVGVPTVKDWYNGGKLYHYSDIGYILSDDDLVTAILMPGNRIDAKLKTIVSTLGEPSFQSYSELEGINYYYFDTGQFRLGFVANGEEYDVENILLTKIN